MASLDDIYDIIQKLEDGGIEYLLITVQNGKKQGKADVFYSLKDRSSMKILARGLGVFNQEIDNIEKQDEDNEQDE